MTLESDLLRVEGVRNASVTVEPDGPLGIRIEVDDRADRDDVAQAVRAVLEARGLSAAFASAKESSGARPSQAASAVTSSPPVRERPPAPDRHRIGLGSVAIAESDRGVELAVRMVDGRRATRRCAGRDHAVWQCLAEMLYDLGDRATARPYVQAVDWLTVDGTPIVTVVVDVGDGHRRIGAAPVRATRGLAVGKAIWSALG